MLCCQNKQSEVEPTWPGWLVKQRPAAAEHVDVVAAEMKSYLQNSRPFSLFLLNITFQFPLDSTRLVKCFSYSLENTLRSFFSRSGELFFTKHLFILETDQVLFKSVSNLLSVRNITRITLYYASFYFCSKSSVMTFQTKILLFSKNLQRQKVILFYIFHWFFKCKN